MNYFKLRFLALMALVVFAAQPALASKEPDLPPQCASIEVPAGNKFSFHVYARGVQIYKWNGAIWEFVAPVATLFVEESFHGEVGIHYVGAIWESKSGSKVKAARVLNTGCTPDSSAIPWLLLESIETSGKGIFGRTTFIQRTNTTGGLAPTTPGTVINEQKEVPYTAEYYFYRDKHKQDK